MAQWMAQWVMPESHGLKLPYGSRSPATMSVGFLSQRRRRSAGVAPSTRRRLGARLVARFVVSLQHPQRHAGAGTNERRGPCDRARGTTLQSLMKQPLACPGPKAIPRQGGAIRHERAPGSVPSRAAKCAIAGRIGTESSQATEREYRLREIDPATRNIKDRDVLLVYVRIAGRCLLRGCNSNVVEHHLTRASGSFGEVAQIFAFQVARPPRQEAGRPKRPRHARESHPALYACHRAAGSCPGVPRRAVASNPEDGR
jgi:hypothetical protein